MQPAPQSITDILELARWAPSGDNTQPWRFEIIDDYHVRVYFHDTRDHCVYDLDGHASEMAWGALLETMRIAATAAGWNTVCQRRPENAQNQVEFDVFFQPQAGIQPDPLWLHIPERSVQRRRLSTQPLTTAEKQTLEAAAAPFTLVWHEGFLKRWNIARMLFASAKIRLISPEAYQVHKSIIAWNSRYSEDKVPDQAIGLDPATLKLMAWVMQRWERVEFFNRYLMGTIAPRLQLDLIPALACASHFRLLAHSIPVQTENYIEAGRSLQRVWLSATRLGIMMQPEMTPLIFARYARENRIFTQNRRAITLAERIASRLADLWGVQAPATVFLGRIGHGAAPAARSLRKKVAALLLPHGPRS